MTKDWRAAIDLALEANGTSLLALAPRAESPVLRRWLTRIEAGDQVEPTPTNYMDLSDLTGIDVEVLTGEVSPSDTFMVAMRSRGRVAPENVLKRAAQVLRTSGRVLKQERSLDRIGALSELQGNFRHATTAQLGRSSGLRAAQMVRAQLELGTEPILDLAEVVERLGVAVEFTLDLPSGLHGFTSWTQTREAWIAAIAINARDPWTVQRYSLAHEICHVLHQDRPEGLTTELNNDASISRKDPTELRAEAFASNFLAPHAGLADHWRSSGLGDQPIAVSVAQAMWHWGMSCQATCYALEACTSVSWTKAQTDDVLSGSVSKMIRDAGLSEAWSLMQATEGAFGPSVWLSEATAALFVDSRLPIENYAMITQQSPEDSMHQLLVVD